MGVGQAADSEQPVRRHGPQTGSQLFQILPPVHYEAAGPLVAERLRQCAQARSVGGSDAGPVLDLDTDDPAAPW